jgi:hypothetical protein
MFNILVLNLNCPGGIGEEQQPGEDEPNSEEPPPETEPAAAHGLNEEEGPKPPEVRVLLYGSPCGLRTYLPSVSVCVEE